MAWACSVTEVKDSCLCFGHPRKRVLGTGLGFRWNSSTGVKFIDPQTKIRLFGVQKFVHEYEVSGDSVAWGSLWSGAC